MTSPAAYGSLMGRSAQERNEPSTNAEQALAAAKRADKVVRMT
jgi:hypothetical protein